MAYFEINFSCQNLRIKLGKICKSDLDNSKEASKSVLSRRGLSAGNRKWSGLPSGKDIFVLNIQSKCAIAVNVFQTCKLDFHTRRSIVKLLYVFLEISVNGNCKYILTI